MEVLVSASVAAPSPAFLYFKKTKGKALVSVAVEPKKAR